MTHIAPSTKRHVNMTLSLNLRLRLQSRGTGIANMMTIEISVSTVHVRAAPVGWHESSPSVATSQVTSDIQRPCKLKHTPSVFGIAPHIWHGIVS